MAVRRSVLALLPLIALTGPAKSEVIALTVTPVGETLTLPAMLFKPEDDGRFVAPFPAIVMLHDCSGVGKATSGWQRRWAIELVVEGYVVIVPDSFTPRGFPEGICTVGAAKRRTVHGYVRAADAHGALARLRTLPYVDGKRIGVMGGEQGGWSTLAALVAPVQDGPLAEAKRDGFAAGLALYPICERYGTWSVTRAAGERGPVTGYEGIYRALAPLFILFGELDDGVEPCRVLVETGSKAGYPLAIKIYPGAYRGFDSPGKVRLVAERDNPNAVSGKGMTVGGNAEAWADAKLEVQAFFATHLKQTR